MFTPECDLIGTCCNASLPLADESFMANLVGSVVDHHYDLKVLVHDIYRLLSHGGVAILSLFPSWSSHPSLLSNYSRKKNLETSSLPIAMTTLSYHPGAICSTRKRSYVISWWRIRLLRQSEHRSMSFISTMTVLNWIVSCYQMLSVYLNSMIGWHSLHHFNVLNRWIGWLIDWGLVNISLI